MFLTFLVSIFKKAAGCRKKSFQKQTEGGLKSKKNFGKKKEVWKKERVTKKFKLFCPSFRV